MTDLQGVTPIRDWPEDEKPRERLLKYGIHTLSDTELIALLLRTGNGAGGRDVIEISRQLLQHFGGLRHLASRELSELCQVSGVGPVKAAQIASAIEIGRRLEAQDMEQKSFVSSTDVARYFMPRLRDLRKEIFMVLMLDARNCLIRGVTVSVGSLTASIVHPREVFKPAILDSAASVIFVHNHPSGDPTPSQDDLKITAQLVDAGQMIDIKVLDHIIIGRKSFTSLAGKGLI